ncbi:hypothetical protein QFC20_001954 [Naganishia adeliensis]|uniref:Uncharacterized protein n=1 Tax=Naganishia adeliensis TaxID=92952 RepID=A0ACC2WPQ0_9TREE|nr:hypothetical protein QFC20_001954 [Naganishia adeliensis]
MVEARQSEVAGQAGLKGSVYEAIATWCNDPEDLIGADKTPSSVCSRYQHLKSKVFEPIELLVNKSGAGWDEANHCPTLPDSSWEALASSSNPRSKAAAKLRHKSFPLYHLYKVITTGHMAVGTHARAIGQPKTARGPRTSRGEEEDELVPTEVSDDDEDDDAPVASSSTTAATACASLSSTMSTAASRQNDRVPVRRQARSTVQAAALSEISSVGKNLYTLAESTAQQSMAAIQKQLEDSGAIKTQKAYEKIDTVAEELNLSDADKTKITYYLMFTMNDNRHLDMFLAYPHARVATHVQMLLRAATRDERKWGASPLKSARWERLEQSDDDADK